MTPKRIEQAKQLLLKSYGHPAPRPPQDPLDQLVATILSQNTSDRNSQRAFQRLKKRFPTWESVLEARPEELARAIQCGGLAQIKAVRIREVLEAIRQREGSLSLERLRGMAVNEALAWLMELNGVGIKTACCVLLFAFGRTVMPVDTHVYRVAQRLGWLGGRVPIEQAHGELHKLIAPAERYAMHLLLIRHGREVCQALQPRCERCALRPLCPSAAAVRPARAAAGGLPTAPPRAHAGSSPADGPGRG